ncbi:MAG: M23 family metallopeptidase [Muribaculaceae bacterium]|nr:M23 family metallopeptidase [Muribaculaceae bacterium]
MSKKIYYRYNPLTETYERVYPSRKSRIFTAIGHFAVSLVMGATVFWALSEIVDLPKERALKNENRELSLQLRLLGERMDEAQDVMDHLADRDNNFYRVMMQADPITDADRFAGLNRTRYDKLASMTDNQLVSTLSDGMNLLERKIYVQTTSFDQLKELASTRQDRLAHIPAIQPVAEKHLKQMASGYGSRIDPIYGTVKFHEGMDFASNIGTPVYATGNGTVVLAKWNSGYGNCIEIDHGFNYLTRYAHLSEIMVTDGQSVKRGDMIGKVGNSGKSTGPHLHYEVRLKGVPQNPVNYYFFDLTPEEYAAMIERAENAGHVMD